MKARSRKGIKKAAAELLPGADVRRPEEFALNLLGVKYGPRGTNDDLQSALTILKPNRDSRPSPQLAFRIELVARSFNRYTEIEHESPTFKELQTQLTAISSTARNLEGMLDSLPPYVASAIDGEMTIRALAIQLQELDKTAARTSSHFKPGKGGKRRLVGKEFLAAKAALVFWLADLALRIRPEILKGTATGPFFDLCVSVSAYASGGDDGLGEHVKRYGRLFHAIARRHAGGESLIDLRSQLLHREKIFLFNISGG